MSLPWQPHKLYEVFAIKKCGPALHIATAFQRPSFVAKCSPLESNSHSEAKKCLYIYIDISLVDSHQFNISGNRLLSVAFDDVLLA